MRPGACSRLPDSSDDGGSYAVDLPRTKAPMSTSRPAIQGLPRLRPFPRGSASRLLFSLVAISMKRSRRSLEARLSLLSQVRALLASTLDRERVLSRVVRLAVPALGDLCAVDLLGEDGTTRRVACAHRTETKEALVYETPIGVRAAIRSGRPIIVSEASESDLMAEALNADQLGRLQLLRPRAWLVPPPNAPDRVPGALTFATPDIGGGALP